MKAKNQKPIKGMAFGGCSFTWGQSLWYYTNLPTLIEQKYNTYDPQYVNFTHRAFTEANRFPRLVAQHFRTYELCQPFNGGSNSTILDYWTKALQENADIKSHTITNRNFYSPSYNLNDIDCFIAQFSAWPRSNISFTHRGKSYTNLQRWNLFSDLQAIFYEYLDDNNLDIERFFDKCKAEDAANLRNFLLDLQSKGLRVYCLCWPADLVPYIVGDSWLNSIFIRLNYEGNTFTDIQTLIEEYPEMNIMGDYEFFEEPPQDGHPSLKCHRVIADSIISHIERENHEQSTTYTV